MVDERERDLILEKMEQANIRNMGAYLRKMAIDGYVVKLDLSDVRELVRLGAMPRITATSSQSGPTRRAASIPQI